MIERRTSRPPWSLRQRLVLGIVALLTVISSLIGAASVLVLREALVQRLDEQLASSLQRAQTFLPQWGSGLPESPPGIGSAQSAGTLGLIVNGGEILAPRYLDEQANVRVLTDRQQRILVNLRAYRPATVQLGGELGSYRVITAKTKNGLELIVGLPLRDVDATTRQLILIILVVSALGIAVAASVSAFVVRLALRPLSEVVATASRVSELELDRGEVALAERVPIADSRESTEVGQVGASLNRMLEHVAAALAARHSSEQKVRQFVADASHELRTPLASIRGYSELTRLSGHELPADIVKSLSRIESESVRMTSLVEELLLLARLDEGAELSTEIIQFAPLVADAVEDAKASSPEHQWILHVDDDSISVAADQTRIHQAFANLLTNARVHTPPGTQIEVGLAQTDQWVYLTVSDNGPGIPHDLLPHLFERFVRGDNSRSRRAGSTGLGLAIAKSIVEAHGGTIRVKSQPGETVFTVALRATEQIGG